MTLTPTGHSGEDNGKGVLVASPKHEPISSVWEGSYAVRKWYTVVGVYTENWQKFCDHVLATSPREAERIIFQNPAIDDDLIIAAVFEGQFKAVDDWAISAVPNSFRPTLGMCWLHDRLTKKRQETDVE